MKNLLLTIAFCITGIYCLSQDACPEPFFSEYIEGSSSNKAFEIYNPRSTSLDLTEYVVYRNNNGSLTPTDSLFPQGTIAAYDVFVLGNPSANPAIIAEADTTHTMSFYNGDDAVWLKSLVSGDTLDIIGVIGEDPGSGWVVGSGATNNTTLIRKYEVTQGQTNWVIGATEWDVFSIDMTDSLGAHTTEIIPTTTESIWSSVATDLTVDFTDESTGDVSTYLWDFGDGVMSLEASPEHVYASAGDYVVCQTVVSSCSGLADSSCAIITVTDCTTPEAIYSTSSDELVIGFTDESTGGGEITYLWDFGDGETSDLANPNHTYATVGTYTVCLTVLNACGIDSTCSNITVCELASPTFVSSSTGLMVSFTDETDGVVASYAWDFGDGETSDLENPDHTYSEAGTYTVCLVVTNDCGSVTTCETIVICDFPVAEFTYSISDETVTFEDGSTGGEDYLWDFGDGTTSDVSDPWHTYSEADTYTVCLTVTNTCGEVDSTCMNIEIGVSGVNEAGLLREIVLYPNPVNSKFTIDLGDSFENVYVTITGINGKLVYQNGFSEVQFLSEELDPDAGVYFVEISSDSHSTVLKLIKE